MYEGRTRGKRIKYTFSDEEDASDSVDARRSTRQSGISTPAEPAGPTFTASGRQVRARHGGLYGETMHSGQQDAMQQAENPHSRENSIDGELVDGERVPRGLSNRFSAPGQTNGRRGGAHIDTYNSVDEMDEESDAESSGGEWDGGDDEEDDDMADDDQDDEDDAMSSVEEEEGVAKEKRSLLLSFKYQKGDQESTAGSPAVPNGMSKDHSNELKLPNGASAPCDPPPKPEASIAEAEHKVLPINVLANGITG